MQHIQPYLYLHGFLPSVALTFTWWAFLYRFRISMWSLALLAFPGTAAHEFSHFLVGLLLLAKPKGFTLLPRRVNNSWVFGSVSFHGINLLNAAFVALAPLLLLPLAWLCLIYLVAPLWTKDQFGWWILAGYLTATLLFAGVPSSQDFKVGGKSIFFYGAIAGLYWLGTIGWVAYFQ